jgi:integrase
VAFHYQKYILLAMFASVPDRQRTFRELALGTTFIKQTENTWVIKHGPGDYKTGGSYGDRPPLVLPAYLTPSIDDWIEHYRPLLHPSTDALFVQARTGLPMSSDSLHNLVSKTIFQYSGKKTNPHLLRDMVVTHVRDGTATEKELEALALYMGHSIAMQRSSYDRRTLQQKVAPAVNLLLSLSQPMT